MLKSTLAAAAKFKGGGKKLLSAPWSTPAEKNIGATIPIGQEIWSAGFSSLYLIHVSEHLTLSGLLVFLGIASRVQGHSK